MAKSEKPAKLITRLLDQTKLDASSIKSLQSQLAAANANADACVQATITTLTNQHSEQTELLKTSHANELERLHASHAADWKAAAEHSAAKQSIIGDLRDKMLKLEGNLAASMRQVDDLTLIKAHQEGRIAELEAQLATLKPELELMEVKKTELTKLCDDVRARMRRKERDEEQAILNRKAVTIAVPRFNRSR